MTHCPACGWSMAGPVLEREPDDDVFAFTCRRCGHVEHEHAVDVVEAEQRWHYEHGIEELDAALTQADAASRRACMRLVMR